MDNTKQENGSLAGKKVIVLGGSAGLGLATAKAAAGEGAEVTIISSNQQRIDKALTQLPANAKGYAINLTKEQAIKDFFEQSGNFDHLVYTAGETLKIMNLADVAVPDAKQYFETRFWGAITTVKYATPKINKGGSFVMTSGAAGIKPAKGWSLGASMCNAMVAFSKAMAIELAPIRVNVVIPGMVKTVLWSSFPEADREAMFAHVASTLPVQYVAGPEDIAKTYLHLMQQPYMTGQSIVVDGGYLLM